MGLWSVESGLATPPTPATQRESPALAHHNSFPLTKTVMAVQPAISSFRLSAVLMALSHSRKPCLMASSMSPSLYSGLWRTCLWRLLAAWAATLEPPCPSNTPKYLTRDRN